MTATDLNAELKVAVIGDGGWGTALALLLAENGVKPVVWCAFEENAEACRIGRENTRYLPGVPLPDTIEWTADPGRAATGADLAIIAVPSKYCRSVFSRFHGLLPGKCRLLSVVKGLDPDTGDRITRLAESILGLFPIAVLSGPSHAEEVARGIPTAVVAASTDPGYSAFIQRIFSNDRFRTYTSADIAGVELGGALKNVIAVAVGISDGLGFGDNTRAAIITRGLAEMTRLGTRLGGGTETFAGLSGLGDLVVTCTSRHSRNRSFGERIGKGETYEKIAGNMNQVAEGATNCATITALARKLNVDMPITAEANAVLHHGKNPMEAVRSLMQRDLKPE